MISKQWYYFLYLEPLTSSSLRHIRHPVEQEIPWSCWVLMVLALKIRLTDESRGKECDLRGKAQQASSYLSPLWGNSRCSGSPLQAKKNIFPDWSFRHSGLTDFYIDSHFITWPHIRRSHLWTGFGWKPKNNSLHKRQHQEKRIINSLYLSKVLLASKLTVQT